MFEDSDHNAKVRAMLMAERFRGYLPVVVDVETGGFNASTDALLEIAATTFRMREDGILEVADTYSYNVEPFSGSNIEASALEFTGIDPFHPFREAIPEHDALTELFSILRKAVKRNGCNRAILTAHNASFDQAFINAAIDRCGIKRSPFHPFSSFDTASLAGLTFGQTVLAKTCQIAGLEFDNSKAHSAAYDAEKTAQLFCLMVNRWRELGGWQLAQDASDMYNKTESDC